MASFTRRDSRLRATSTQMKLAAAPISWGVCEVPGWGAQVSNARVLSDAAALGFRAIEAGPPGLLPAGAPGARGAPPGLGRPPVGGRLAPPRPPSPPPAGAGRVRHVHLKDVDGRLASAVRAGKLGYADAVRGGLYRPLGMGDAGVDAVLRALGESRYAGWYVLEQDVALEPAQAGAAAFPWIAESLRYVSGRAA